MTADEEIKHRLDHLEKVTGDIFDANAKYYATRDTAVAGELNRLIIQLFRECLEKIADR